MFTKSFGFFSGDIRFFLTGEDSLPFTKEEDLCFSCDIFFTSAPSFCTDLECRLLADDVLCSSSTVSLEDVFKEALTVESVLTGAVEGDDDEVTCGFFNFNLAFILKVSPLCVKLSSEELPPRSSAKIFRSEVFLSVVFDNLIGLGRDLGAVMVLDEVDESMGTFLAPFAMAANNPGECFSFRSSFPPDFAKAPNNPAECFVSSFPPDLALLLSLFFLVIFLEGGATAGFVSAVDPNKLSKIFLSELEPPSPLLVLPESLFCVCRF